MSESSLSIQLADLAAEVGGYLGYGRTPSAWTGWQAASPYVSSSADLQLGHVMACVQGGLRQFYFPPITEASPVAHKWSFMTPQRQLVTVASKGTYDLPDDFNGVQGEFTYQPTDSTWITVRRVGPGEVSRTLQQLFSVTGKPEICAVLPKQSDGVIGQRFSVSFAPVPDAEYTLTYACNLLPAALSYANPYPYGGAAHGETILESCLAVAERRFQDESGGTHWQAFLSRLQASITVDTRDFKPAYMGYNGDRSDGYGQYPWGPWTGTQATGATYNGQQF